MTDPNHDIVPTLRMFDGLIMGQAADEIEKLRAELKTTKQTLMYHQSCNEANYPQLKKAREDVQFWRDDRDAWEAKAMNALSALAEAQAHIEYVEAAGLETAHELGETRAETEKLRAELAGEEAIREEYGNVAIKRGDELIKANNEIFLLRERATEAEAKLAGALVDAERYRWLRDKSVPPHNFYISVPVEFHGVRYSPQEVDAAIDAALSGSGRV